MELAARIGTMARRGAPLPYLRRVAYLESHGTEYIDTGYKMTDYQVIARSRVRFTSPLSAGLYGVTWHDGSNDSRFGFGVNENGLPFYFGLGEYNLNTPIHGDTNWHLFLLDGKNKIGKIDDNSFSIPATRFTPNDQGVHVFCSYFKFNPYLPSKSQCDFYTLIDANTNKKIIDLISVLDLSGRPAMYDEVSGQLFYNQGTGEFTWGELET